MSVRLASPPPAPSSSSLVPVSVLGEPHRPPPVGRPGLLRPRIVVVVLLLVVVGSSSTLLLLLVVVPTLVVELLLAVRRVLEVPPAVCGGVRVVDGAGAAEPDVAAI